MSSCVISSGCLKEEAVRERKEEERERVRGLEGEMKVRDRKRGIK